MHPSKSCVHLPQSSGSSESVTGLQSHTLEVHLLQDPQGGDPDMELVSTCSMRNVIIFSFISYPPGGTEQYHISAFPNCVMVTLFL